MSPPRQRSRVLGASTRIVDPDLTMTGQPNKKTTPTRKILADALLPAPGIEIGLPAEGDLVVLEARFLASNSSNAFNPFAAIRTTVLLGSLSDGLMRRGHLHGAVLQHLRRHTQSPSVHGDHGRIHPTFHPGDRGGCSRCGFSSIASRIAKVLALTSGDDFPDLHSHVSVAPADHLGEVVAIGDPGTINGTWIEFLAAYRYAHTSRAHSKPTQTTRQRHLRVLTEGRERRLHRPGRKALRLSRGDEDEDDENMAAATTARLPTLTTIRR